MTVRSVLRHAVVPLALVLDLLLWGGNGSTRLGFHLPPQVVIGVTSAAFIALLWRRTRPVLAYTVLWFHAVTLGLLVPTYQPFAGVLVALYQFARHGALRRVWPALAMVGVPVGIWVTDVAASSHLGPVEIASSFLLWFVIIGIDWGAGRVARRVEMTAVLQQEKLVVESTLAMTNQRVRLAGELHDIVAGAVTLMIIQAGGARQLPADDPRKDLLLTSIESTGVDAMSELRQLLSLLSPMPSTAEKTGTQGTDSEPITAETTAVTATTPTTITAESRRGAVRYSPTTPGPNDPVEVSTGPLRGLSSLPTLLCQIRATGVSVDAATSAVHQLPAGVDQVAYRVVQESLVNVAKHAGHGAHCQVSVDLDSDGNCRIEVCDDGGLRGVGRMPAAMSSGRGLDGLRSRLDAVNGQLVVRNQVSGGFRVVATIPAVHPSAAAVGEPTLPLEA